MEKHTEDPTQIQLHSHNVKALKALLFLKIKPK